MSGASAAAGLAPGTSTASAWTSQGTKLSSTVVGNAARSVTFAFSPARPLVLDQQRTPAVMFYAVAPAPVLARFVNRGASPDARLFPNAVAAQNSLVAVRTGFSFADNVDRYWDPSACDPGRCEPSWTCNCRYVLDVRVPGSWCVPRAASCSWAARRLFHVPSSSRSSMRQILH